MRDVKGEEVVAGYGEEGHQQRKLEERAEFQAEHGTAVQSSPDRAEDFISFSILPSFCTQSASSEDRTVPPAVAELTTSEQIWSVSCSRWLSKLWLIHQPRSVGVTHGSLL